MFFLFLFFFCSGQSFVMATVQQSFVAETYKKEKKNAETTKGLM